MKNLGLNPLLLKNNRIPAEDNFFDSAFLDNVLEDFIVKAPDTMSKAKYSAMRERSIGIGVMGFHSFLQSKKTPFESVAAKSWNKAIFKHIREKCDIANEKLADEKGACPDALELGINNRFSNTCVTPDTTLLTNIAGGYTANLNNGGEYHNLYAKALEKVALLSVGGSSNFNNITGKMTNIIIPPEQLTEINKLSEYKELYPMYNEINITMDKFSSFSTLLKDSGLTLSLINYVINSSASVADFYLSEEKVNYSFNVDTDNISEIDTSIYEQGIQTSISTELVTGSVKLYDLYNWWLLTQQDYTLNKTNQDKRNLRLQRI
jgi:hypothetical protein